MRCDTSQSFWSSMSPRGESSLGSIFIYLRFVVFLAAEMALISRSRAAETPALHPKLFIPIKAGRLMDGGYASADRAEEDGGAATDQKPRSSEDHRHSHQFQGPAQAPLRQTSCFQQKSCSGQKEKSHPGHPNNAPLGPLENAIANPGTQLWPVTFELDTFLSVPDRVEGLDICIFRTTSVRKIIFYWYFTDPRAMLVSLTSNPPLGCCSLLSVKGFFH